MVVVVKKEVVRGKVKVSRPEAAFLFLLQGQHLEGPVRFGAFQA